eukprot:TRINITY_DN9020_c0_g1_i2.p1 TRINITY_DN9020_c0_g1~~TRINITY_DN9020_c0_g1_i2.p1  ORF type:complete len:775 (+),score=290.08 TRINITY_DN9020_c0_g1_i2:539-2863(+)
MLIGIESIRLAKSVSIRYAGLTYDSDYGPPPSIMFGAEAGLDVIMGGQLVDFTGKLYMQQTATTTSLGFSFSASGIIPRVFGLTKLHMYDLVLAAEVGLVAGVPAINSITIGGGMCFGPIEKCKPLVSGFSESELLQQGHSTVPTHADFQKHTQLVEQRKLEGAFAAKMYAGFSEEGDAFFYAGFSRVTLADVANALIGESKLPGWLGRVGIQEYDPDLCKAQGGTACFAYMSYSLQDKLIEELNPPLFIPGGFAMSGRLHLFGAYMKLQMSFRATQMIMKLDASPLNLLGGNIKVCRLRDSSDKGFAETFGQVSEQTLVGWGRRRRRRSVAARRPTSAPTVTKRVVPTPAPSKNAPSAAPTTALSAAVDCTKGPYLYMDADPANRNFKLDFNAYAKLGPLGEGGVKVSVTPTTFEGTLNMAIFGSALTADVYAKVSLVDPSKIALAAYLDLTALNKLLKPVVDLTKAAIAPIEKLREAVLKAKQVIIGGLETAKQKLAAAQKKVDEATAKCKNAAASVEAKKKSCGSGFIQTKAKIFGRRRRRWGLSKAVKKVGGAISKAGKAVGKAVVDTAKKAAAELCKAALTGLSATMKAACTTGKVIASGALKAAQASLSAVQKAVDAIASLAAAALSKVIEIIEFLTAYELQKIGFKAETLSPSVTLILKILNTKKKSTTEYQFKLSLEKISFKSLANAAFKAIFEPIYKAGVKLINSIKDKMSSPFMVLIDEGVVEPQTQIELVHHGLIQVNHTRYQQLLAMTAVQPTIGWSEERDN